MNLEIISKYPAAERHSTPLLFVHGMFCTASSWDKHFLGYFARHGYASHAVNLRGHGNSDGKERLRWTRIAEFVEDVEQAVGELPAPPVIIGHSMGGFITQKYLEDHDARAAVLLSSPSPSGMLPTVIRKALKHPLTLAKINLTLNLRHFIATPKLALDAFFSDELPEAQLIEYWKQMQDDSVMAFLDMIALDLPRPEKVKTPILVIGAGRDNMIAPRENEETARAYNTQPVFVPNVAHNSMLEVRWQRVADCILSWLRERGFADREMNLKSQTNPHFTTTTGDYHEERKE